MTKQEFTSAWRQFQTILTTYGEYRETCIGERAARVMVTPEMFLGEDKEDTPEWQNWTRAWNLRGTALHEMLDAMDMLKRSDVGELLREADGPFALDVDPEPAPTAESDTALAVIDPQPKVENDGASQNPRLRSQGGEGYAARQARSEQGTQGD